MKVLYSEIKKIVPGLKADAKKVGNFLTMAGFMMESLEKVKYRGKSDCLLGLEVRHNRADCFSTFGIAREVAAKWGLKLKLPETEKLEKLPRSKNITVYDGRYVKRVVAYEILEIRNKKSPDWLVEYLKLYGMNSKNMLVDLSNYIMLQTGYPSHLLDMSKMGGKLRWDVNQKFNEIATLDGTRITLKKENEIILRDDKNVLALAGIVGGKHAEIDFKTNSIIAESAIYLPAAVRQNSLNLKVVTEASSRLGKYLDPNGLDYAMKLLVSMIMEHCGGEKTRIKLFQYYPHKISYPKINFNPSKPSKYAGIEIGREESIKILLNLGFQAKNKNKSEIFIVTPPTNRLDVQIEEDLIEEVIRLKGFEKIPVNEVPELAVTRDITPKVIILSEKIKEVLASLGLDEILSLTMTDGKTNKLTNYKDFDPVVTINSVNEEYPALRLNLAGGLMRQMEEYEKKSIEFIKLFEIGKVFRKIRNKYVENESLGILLGGGNENLNELRNVLEKTLRYLGISAINYKKSKNIPKAANRLSCWNIYIKGRDIGIIYKFSPKEGRENAYFAEVDLNQVAKLLLGFKEKATYELTKKLVSLDTNLVYGREDDLWEEIEKIKRKIGPKNYWSAEIKDAYPVGSKVKYTLRVSYKGLGDQKAKALHLRVFSKKLQGPK